MFRMGLCFFSSFCVPKLCCVGVSKEQEEQSKAEPRHEGVSHWDGRRVWLYIKMDTLVYFKLQKGKKWMWSD